MTPAAFFNLVLSPASQRFGAMGFQVVNNQASRILLMAIAGIESDWSDRLQIGGPARSYWQCEAEGAVADVYANADTQQWVVDTCNLWDIETDAGAVYEAIAFHDPLAYTVARLALWLDPAPLPTGADACWAYYLRNWRPGKPRPNAWPVVYAQALAVVK